MFALMCRNGAECAPSETAAVHVDRVAYHLIGRDCLSFVARVRVAGIGQIERSVNLSGGHWRKHRIHLHGLCAIFLPEHRSWLHPVAFLLYMLEVFGLFPLLRQTFFE